MRYYREGIMIGVFLLFFNAIWAQIDTLYICNPGDAVQLNAPSGSYIYQWFPVDYLNNPTTAQPIATPGISISYTVRRIPVTSAENLIVNPDFSEGNTGFVSDYMFEERKVFIQGAYGINESAANLNAIYFSDCPDHTSGSGKMMVVDGSPRSNENVWCQEVTVTPVTNYAFSTWLTSVNPSNPALLQFFINDEAIGTVFSAGQEVCEWRPFFEIWESGNVTDAEICIVNKNTNPNGNDFALDDFAFYPLEEVLIDTVVVIVEALEAAKERRVYFPSAFSPNRDGINDLFMPLTGKGVTVIKQFKIFDRWGNQVFNRENCKPNDADCAWDGSFNEEALNPGLYVYFAQVQFADHSMDLFKGEVWIIR